MCLFVDSRKAKGFGKKVPEKFVEKRAAAQEETAVEMQPELETELKHEVESETFERPDDEVGDDEQGEPEFLQKLQDIEVVEGSAARFDVRVKGMYHFVLLTYTVFLCYVLYRLGCYVVVH